MKHGLLIESHGLMPDGATTASSDIVSRIDADSMSWQSVNRRVAGKKLERRGTGGSETKAPLTNDPFCRGGETLAEGGLLPGRKVQE